VNIGVRGGYQVYTPCSNGTSGSTYNCPGDPTVDLRLVSLSRSFSVDCGNPNVPGGPQSSTEQEIQYGCANTYQVNTPDVCPDPANPNPPDCVPVVTGTKVGQVQKAMNNRWAPNGVCDANNYPGFASGDPRVVILIITDFSAWAGQGSNASVPVTVFGAFYVSGWSGAPIGCTGVNESAPLSAAGNGNGQTADIWGHFVKYVDTQGSGNPGLTCDPTGLLPCVPVLTQ
jgi:hypothetical protein